MDKYRKALFNTNDREYPFLFLRNDGIYTLINADGTLTGDGFDGVDEVLKYFPETDLEELTIEALKRAFTS
jgi:hypothetical protein